MLEQVLRRSRELGFLGPGAIEVHLRQARELSNQLPNEGSWLDLGAGGGVPGLILAVDAPDQPVTLLDANQRRCAFLRWAVGELDLQRVEIAEGRAELLAHSPKLREAASAVIARGFGPPAVTLEIAAGLVAVGGTVSICEPPDGDSRWEGNLVERLGFTPPEYFHTEFHFVRFRKLRAAEPTIPRTPGRIQRQAD